MVNKKGVVFLFFALVFVTIFLQNNAKTLYLPLSLSPTPRAVSITPGSGSSNVNIRVNFTSTFEFEIGAEYITNASIWMDVESPIPHNVNISFHGMVKNESGVFRYYGMGYSPRNEDCGGGCTERCCYKNYDWDIGGFEVGSQNKIYIFNDILGKDDVSDGSETVIAEWRVVEVNLDRARLSITWEVQFRDFFANKDLLSFAKAEGLYPGGSSSSGWEEVGSWSITSFPDPCNQAGTFCPPGATGRSYDTTGYCVDAETYYGGDFNFRPLEGDYSCGSNFCCVGCADENCCWGLRGYCYEYSSSSSTGCLTYPNQLSDRCSQENGISCTESPGNNVIVDPPSAYGPIRCVAEPTTTTTSTTTPEGTTTPEITTTTSTTVSTTTDSTTTTQSTTTTLGDTTSTTVSTTTSSTTTTINECPSQCDWGHCDAPNCICPSGEGDCNLDSDCQGNLVCCMNVGAYYGCGSSVDICLTEDECNQYHPTTTTPTSTTPRTTSTLSITTTETTTDTTSTTTTLIRTTTPTSVITTTTTPSPTTTGSELEPCPYECCIDELRYRDKRCSRGLVCCDNICKESCEPSSGRGKLVAGFIFVLLIAVVVFVVYRMMKSKKMIEEPYIFDRGY